jgi:hypothetical protein
MKREVRVGQKGWTFDEKKRKQSRKIRFELRRGMGG